MTRHAPNIFFHSALDAKDSLGHTSIICGRSWTVQQVLHTPQRRREENRNVHTEALAKPAGTTAPVIYKCRHCRGALSDCLDELLILFPDSLGVGFAVRIKAFLAALFPCRFAKSWPRPYPDWPGDWAFGPVRRKTSPHAGAVYPPV